MKKIPWLLLVLPALAGATEDLICALGPDAGSYSSYVDRRPTTDATELAGKIVTALQPVCEPNCRGFRVLRNSTVPNVMFLRAEGELRVIYRPETFTAIYEADGEPGILALLAHEVGHVLDGAANPGWFGKDWSAELRGDAWSACALARMDLGQRPLSIALKTLARYPSPAHPRWSERLPVLRTAWARCGGDGARFDAAAKP